MRIALLYPEIKRNYHGCFSPLSLLYLATPLRQEGFEVRIFDPDAYRGGVREMSRAVIDYRPDVIGISVLTEHSIFSNTQYLCNILRKKFPSAKIILGGAHASAWPHRMFEWFPEIDFVLEGEADLTFINFIKQLQSNTAEPRVSGLSYRKAGEIVSLPGDDFPKNLDALPIPDRKIIWDNYKKGIYWRIEHRGSTDMMLTSRGCPFNCNFCFKVSKGIRLRSPENVFQEMEYLVSLGIKAIHIEDDLFTANKERAIAICRLIRKAKLSLNFKVRSRVNTIDEELLGELRGAGAKMIVFGIESGSQKMLDAMNKNTTVEQNIHAIELSRKLGFYCYADMFVGYPGENYQTLEETKKFLLRAKPFAVSMATLIPLPCTHVYEEAKKNSHLLGDWGIGQPTPFIPLPDFLSRDNLVQAAKRIVKGFYADPVIFFRQVIFLLKNLANPNYLRGLWCFLYNLYLKRNA